MKTQLKQEKKSIGGGAKKGKLACDPVQVKMLAINCSTMAEAEQSLPKLPNLIARHKEIAAAWQRGRFLRNLRGLASVPVTLAEAARRLNLNEADALQTILEIDHEAGDTWHQTRYDAFTKIKIALVKTAFEGNQAAIRAIENFLRIEMDHKASGPQRLRISDIADLVGRSRHLIYNWVSRYKLPLGTDKTVELKHFLRWFETFTAGNAASKNGGKSDQESRLHAMKAESIEMELKRRRHELLDRDEVMAGILARHQVLINSMRKKAPQIAQLCQGQKPERIIKIITDSLADICRELCQVPAELHLPESVAKAYRHVLEILNKDIENHD